MKDKNQQKKEIKKNSNNPDDSLKHIEEGGNEEPIIYAISKVGSSIDRKNFIKSAAAIGGLVALGGLLKSCDESELDIQKSGENCTCHAVCSCNADTLDGNTQYQKGNSFVSKYDKNKNCTCDTVCTCNSICSCDSVSTCSCDSDTGGYYSGYYTYYTTYWYPN